MIKKGQIVILLTFVFVLYFSGFVSANFVCGVVYNSDNSSIVSPAWLHVKVYYPENRSSFTQCQVSPENNKYCCDPNDIKGSVWSIGKNISAELNESGFISQTVNLVSSGNGFDIFPDLHFNKILEITQPNSSFYLGNPTLHLVAKADTQFNNINYTLLKEDSTVVNSSYCQNCTSLDFYIENVSFGKYTFSVTAYNSGSEYTENKNFTILSYININRTISCDGCQGFRVPSTVSNVTITLFLNASDNIDGTLTDRFPSDWIYKGDLQIDETTDSHNSISWKISGNNIQKSYLLVPPKNFFSSVYSFQPIFENFVAKADSILLSKYRFLDFLSFSKRYYQNIRSVNIFKTLLSTISNPIILNPQGLEVIEVAIFPVYPEKDVLSFVKSSQTMKLNESKSNFIIWTSMDQHNIDHLFMRFELSKTSVGNKNVSLFYYDYSSGLWNKQDLQKTGEDKRYFYYQSFSNKTGVYSIL